MSTDLSKFGKYDLKQAAKILTAYSNNDSSHDDFLYSDDGIQLLLGNDGKVYLTNDEYELLGLSDENGKDKLTYWVHTPYYGHEGFIDNVLIDYPSLTFNADDFEYLLNVCDGLNRDEDWTFILGDGNDVFSLEPEAVQYIYDNDLEGWENKLCVPLFKKTDYYNDLSELGQNNLLRLVVSDLDTALGLVGYDDFTELYESVTGNTF